MASSQSEPLLQRVLSEKNQEHETRLHLFTSLEQKLGRPVVTFFTSFIYPVAIEDTDADMLGGVLRCLDLSQGLALVVSSPGGSGLAAERIINVCRSYSGTEESRPGSPSCCLKARCTRQLSERQLVIV